MDNNDEILINLESLNKIKLCTAAMKNEIQDNCEQIKTQESAFVSISKGKFSKALESYSSVFNITINENLEKLNCIEKYIEMTISLQTKLDDQLAMDMNLSDNK